ncbi:MAG: (d)CMP kinase [Proteobacteria bacterium]|nr:(d)CMP kinase [Pseudomonadota bacterium]MBU1058291.1 (d)CMP kinase [Pseudomonadota bacterium]
MSHRQNIVTIDGPSGVGKSTISRRVAQALSFTYLDTGAMYRAVGLKLKDAGLAKGDDESALRQCLDTISLDLFPAAEGSDDVGVILDGRDVSQEIRSPEMSMIASRVSALPVVREKLTHMQQEIGKKGEIVAEGRDTGTVVFPGAAWKFYLDAAPEVRMQRRAKQLRSKGESVDEEELLEMIIKRDRDDQARSIAPLCKAKDALLIDTGGLTIEEVTAAMLEVIRKEFSRVGS